MTDDSRRILFVCTGKEAMGHYRRVRDEIKRFVETLAGRAVGRHLQRSSR